MNTPVTRAAQRLERVLRQESELVATAPLADLTDLGADKARAMAQLTAAGAPTPEDRDALRTLSEAAEENRLILASTASGLGELEARIRSTLRSAADAGVYGPRGRRVANHTGAATRDWRA